LLTDRLPGSQRSLQPEPQHRPRARESSGPADLRGRLLPDVKADLEAVLAPPMRIAKMEHPVLHPGAAPRSSWTVSRSTFRRTASTLAAKVRPPQAQLLFEVDAEVWRQRDLSRYTEILKFPGATRDLAGRARPGFAGCLSAQLSSNPAGNSCGCFI